MRHWLKSLIISARGSRADKVLAGQKAPEDTMSPVEYARRFGVKPYAVMSMKDRTRQVEVMSFPFYSSKRDMLVLVRTTIGDPMSMMHIKCSQLVTK